MTRSSWSPSRAARASWRSGRAGRRCSAATCTNRSATSAAFVGEWYRSGDLVSRDADGYLWFVGRGDDVIKTAGHLVGPFEVESVLMEHPAVVEAAVIGLPGPGGRQPHQGVRHPAPRRRGHRRPATRADRLRPVAARCRARPAPGGVRTHLPHTRSGKIMRRLLRARELGLPEGDLSTLEPSRERRGRFPTESSAAMGFRCGRWCASAASRSGASSSTAPVRSAASCTSTSERKRWPSASTPPSNRRTPSSRPTGSTGTPWRVASR